MQNKLKLSDLETEIRGRKDTAKARLLQRFFKTGPGQYGEGDVFLGLTVPEQRKISGRYGHLPLSDLKRLLLSPIHEFRLIALLILVKKYQSAETDKEKDALARFYLSQARRINNWDLVDLSSPHIAGEYFFRHREKQGEREALAASSNLWVRRIAMLSTFYDIRQGQAGPALRLAKQLIEDKHDLMHKAVGWMLREAGKRTELKNLLDFLEKYGAKMPRTALRYAIERLAPGERAHYLSLSWAKSRKRP